MSTVKPTSKVFAGSYNSQWATKETAIFEPQFLPDVYNVYGDLARTKLANILQLAGRTMKVPNATIKHFEKYSPNFAVTLLGTIASGLDGADISFKIVTTDYDSLNNSPLKLYDSIEIPYVYMRSGVNEDRLYRIHTITGSTNDLTYAASPFNNAGTYDTISGIGTTVPDGTVLRIAHTSFAPGTGQPDGKTDSWATREHVAAILAATRKYEGGQMAQAFQNAILVDMRGGGQGILMNPMLEVGEDLDSQIESYILTGERTDNTTMTMTSQAGSYSASVKSGFGIMKWANILAQEAYHNGTLDITDLDRRKLLLQSQGIASKQVKVICGPEYYNIFEAMGLDYLEQYSNTDLLDASKTLGLELRSFTKGGIQYTPIQLDAFANPSTFGINVGDLYSYQWPHLGLYVPQVMNGIKMNGKDLTLNNVMIGYVSANGEDRTRMTGIKAGPNGVAILPNNGFVSDEYDRFEVYQKTEVMVICVNVNQWILDRLQK